MLAEIDLSRLEIDLLLVTGEAFFPDELEELFPPAGASVSLLLLADDPALAVGLAKLGLPAWGALPLDASPPSSGQGSERFRPVWSSPGPGCWNLYLRLRPWRWTGRGKISRSR